MTRKSWTLLIAVAVVLNAFLALHTPGLRSLDARFWYSVSDIWTLLDELGPDGRRSYILQECVDLVFLSLYSLLAAHAGAAIYRKRGRKVSGKLLAFCLAPGTFDLIETVGILGLLVSYPDHEPAIAAVVHFATPIKWSLGGILILWLIVGAIRNFRESR